MLTPDYFESNGTQLYRQTWKPAHQPRAIAIVMHGLGSHSSGQKHITEYLVSEGYVVHAFDSRGHGKSEGERALLKKSTMYIEDALHFVSMVKEEERRGTGEPDLPIFLVGHSMGGLISLDLTMNYPNLITGVVALAPALMIDRLKETINSITPEVPDEYTIETTPDTDQLTRDPQVLEWMKNDPIRHFFITIGLVRGLLKRVEWMLDHPNQLQTPLLLIQGEQDTIVSVKTNRAFFDSLSIADKTWIGYPDMLHNPQDEIEREDVLMNIGKWLGKHL